MPRYELLLIARTLSREGYSNILRQTCKSIMDKGGVVRKLENLGHQKLPYRMRAHADWHYNGRYFLLDIDIHNQHLTQLEKELKMDPEIIRPRVVKIQSRYDSRKHEHPVLECWRSYIPPNTAA